MNEIDIERRRNNHKTSGKRNLTSRGSLKQGFKAKLMRKEWGCPLFGTIKGNHLNFSGLLLKNDWVLGSHLSVCYTVSRDKHFEVWFISNPLILHLLSPTSSFQAYWVRLNGIDRKLGDPFCYQIQFFFTPNFPTSHFQGYWVRLDGIDIKLGHLEVGGVH